MIFRREIFFLAILIGLSGCATTRQSSTKEKEDQEAISAMRNVAGAVSGQEVSEEDLQNLGRQIQRDPEAKSAVEAITNSMSGQGQGIKYCPVDGQRYSPKFTICPIHHVPLKIVDQ